MNGEADAEASPVSPTVFVTGASGFVGRALCARLAAANWRVRALAHNTKPDSGEFVQGELTKSETYAGALSGVDCVVHLAAMTGKAAPAAYRHVNVEGARALLAACKGAGVKHFLYVSTIAAGYEDQRFYPYAKSKAEAEQLVRESGIPFTILRPTVVLGADSPIWATLQRIARLPFIPLPRGAREVSLQPLGVEEVARALQLIIAQGRFVGETLDLGGPDPELMTDFLRDVRQACVGAPARIVHAPLTPIRIALAALEPLARPFLPVTAGQLALFANDSTARPNWLMDSMRAQMPSTRALIASLIVSETPPPPPPFVAPPPEALHRECDVFTNYLTGVPASIYIREHYARALRETGLANDAAFSAFDRAVLSFARRSPLHTRLADAYCALLHRGASLRRKLVMLVAILEYVAPTNELFDRPQESSPVRVVCGLAARGLAFAVSLLGGVIALTPARLSKSARTTT